MQFRSKSVAARNTERWRVPNGFPRRRVGTRKSVAARNTGRWRVPNGFPRAGVETHFRRDYKAEPQAQKGFKLISRSHAPAWECSFVAKASQLAIRDAGASQMGSHAGAWEPERFGRGCKPSPAKKIRFKILSYIQSL